MQVDVFDFGDWLQWASDAWMIVFYCYSDNCHTASGKLVNGEIDFKFVVYDIVAKCCS